ncbi:MAG TPA: HdeD family acid-resistance protein [Polyangiaceae bacterium]|nr:HdeD family acid-resistance protein [Polyangiaceae bacterium]
MTSWWALALRGLLAIVFGVLTLVMPGLTLVALVLLFGGYAFVEGVFNALGAFRAARAGERWGLALLESLVSVAAGVVTLLMPGLTLLSLVYLVAFWSLVTGGLELAAAVRLRKEIKGEWMLALAGVASIAFGALLLLAPGVGALTIALWVGAYALVFGVTLVALGLRLRARAVGGGRPPPLRPLPGH